MPAKRKSVLHTQYTAELEAMNTSKPANRYQAIMDATTDNNAYVVVSVAFGVDSLPRYTGIFYSKDVLIEALSMHHQQGAIHLVPVVPGYLFDIFAGSTKVAEARRLPIWKNAEEFM